MEGLTTGTLDKICKSCTDVETENMAVTMTEREVYNRLRSSWEEEHTALCAREARRGNRILQVEGDPFHTSQKGRLGQSTANEGKHIRRYFGLKV